MKENKFGVITSENIETNLEDEIQYYIEMREGVGFYGTRISTEQYKKHIPLYYAQFPIFEEGLVEEMDVRQITPQSNEFENLYQYYTYVYFNVLDQLLYTVQDNAEKEGRELDVSGVMSYIDKEDVYYAMSYELENALQTEEVVYMNPVLLGFILQAIRYLEEDKESLNELEEDLGEAEE